MAAVTAVDFVPFDYCDGPNGVRGHQSSTLLLTNILLITIPMLIMYTFFHREIVAGMTSGSVKG